MEDLLGVLFALIIVVISAAVKESKKKQQAKAVIASMPKPQTKPVQTVQMQMDKSRATMPIVPAQPTMQQSAQPKVHTHLTPECDLDAELSGSLQYDSPEGVDKCHEDELRPVHQPLLSEELVEEQSGLTLDFSSKAMLQAVVMQEVLTRPCDRRRR